MKIQITRLSRVTVAANKDRTNTPMEPFERIYDVGNEPENEWKPRIMKELSKELGCDSVLLQWHDTRQELDSCKTCSVKCGKRKGWCSNFKYNDKIINHENNKI